MRVDASSFIRLSPEQYGKTKEPLSIPCSPLARNAHTLEREFKWFSSLLETRLALYFENECVYASVQDVPVPNIAHDPSEYATIVRQFGMSHAERLLFILAAIPHLRPQILNLLLIRDPHIDHPYVEFGGWRGKTHGGFLPTGETAAFLIAGEDLEKRMQVFSLLDRDHFFTKAGILRFHTGEFDEAYLTTSITLSHEYFHRITTGETQKPDFSMHFPAKLLETNLDWDDLVLPPKTLDEIDHLRTWLINQHVIIRELGLHKSIQPGYRALFYGPPGTGKTLTASLLGKAMGSDVYRIDLSSVVSKYIGETEKNLEAIFNQAENRNWILFFDEADALFGKRTETTSSNDRHANQEVAYLLQRIETFPGVIILATNLRGNIDDAFSRRFQSLAYFPMPDVNQRFLLWQKAFCNATCLHESVDFKQLAKQHEITGGAIINVVRFAAIRMMNQGRNKVLLQDLETGISKEKKKQGRVLG
ncbi:ATP-binding protein [Teredinibacter haidensis]|uniref:ATP-binding protein n=1 Tax=Teredinibacter haidensis TaxID=2731755 RepID=UPI000948F47B|nr:ATP-binding protein [Teredinibacter haidensis]